MKPPVFFLSISILFTTSAVGAMADSYEDKRSRFVDSAIAKFVSDPRVVAAVRKVPREQFVPLAWRSFAYADRALPIGEHQTISQPSLVAKMTELLELKEDSWVLEIGTGSGYQAAILAELAKEVFTIEIVPSLSARAAKTLEELGYKNVFFKVGDGYGGWPEKAPFDAIIVTAAAPKIPEALKSQLREGGRLLVPLGTGSQELVLVTRHGQKFSEERLLPVVFVPMVGKVRE